LVHLTFSPIRPSLAKSLNNKYPTAVGGKTKGKVVIVDRTPFPQNERLAKTYANAIPGTATTKQVIAAQSKVAKIVS
jgi:hypothetical protein